MGRHDRYRMHHRATDVDAVATQAAQMTAVTPINQTALRKRIAIKQRQQAARRSHATALQTIIDWCDREIANLQAQLNNATEGTACTPKNGAAEPTAPSADAKSLKHATTPSCPHTPPKPAPHAPCPDERSSDDTP